MTVWPLSRLLELPAREQVYLQTDRPMRPGTQFSVRLRLDCFMMMMIIMMDNNDDDDQVRVPAVPLTGGLLSVHLH